MSFRIKTYSTVVDIPVPNKKKVWDSADEAVKDVKPGDVLLSGGEPLGIRWNRRWLVLTEKARRLWSLWDPRCVMHDRYLRAA